MKVSKLIISTILFLQPFYTVQGKNIDLKDSRVDLPWKEFKEILNKVAEPVNQPIPDTLLPATEYLITTANISGTVINRKAARFMLKVNLEIHYLRISKIMVG